MGVILQHFGSLRVTLKVVNKTVTNALHGTNFPASNGRNRLV